MMFINLRSAMYAAVALVLWGGVASAATIDVENFETLPAGPQTSWSNNDYSYAPTLRTGGQCYSGFCLNEYNSEGDVTTITEDNPPLDGIFSLIGLYVNVNGKVDIGDNFMALVATYADLSTYTMTLSVLNDLTGLTDLMVFNEDGTAATSLTFDSHGYFLAFTGGIFNNVTSMELRSLAQGGTLRVDCVASSHDSAAGTLPESGLPLTQCEPDVQVPEPISLALFGIGALGLALARRRKQQS